MQRYFMLGQYNHTAQEEQALPEPHVRGDWVRYEDAQAEIDRQRHIMSDMSDALLTIRSHFDGATEDEATSAHTMRAIANDVLYRHRVPNTTIRPTHGQQENP